MRGRSLLLFNTPADFRRVRETLDARDVVGMAPPTAIESSLSPEALRQLHLGGGVRVLGLEDGPAHLDDLPAMARLVARAWLERLRPEGAALGHDGAPWDAPGLMPPGRG